MSLEIYLLGQFKLLAGNHTLDLSSRPAQSLLAYLTMTAGMTHRRERLAGLLWPEATDSNARSYLRQALWRIRKVLDSESTIWTDYLLANDVTVAFNTQSDYWLDVDQFMKTGERLPVAELQEVLGLYRGELLPGFYDEWIPPERDRVLAAFQQKMHLLLEQLLSAQRWQDAVQWSEKWIQLAHAPEQAFRALMRAYAGLGDRAMVNATYERCRDLLAQELDLNPSKDTEQLYEALCHAAAEDLWALSGPWLEPASRQPAFLKGNASISIEQFAFVAREAELAKLDQFLKQTLAGQGQVVFITGEAGSGKTSLINEFVRCSLMKQPNLIIAGGSCNMHTGIGDPFLPFRQILEMLTGDVEGRWAAGAIDTLHARSLWQSMVSAAEAVVSNGPDLINSFIHGPALVERIRASDPSAGAFLTRLRQLADRKPDVVATAVMQQSDLFDQVTRALQAISHKQALVLIIDDLQWADLASINLIFHLGRQLTGSPFLLVGAYRPEEIALGRDGLRHPLEPVVNELQREFGNNSINLNQARGRDFVESIIDSELNRLGPSFRHLLYHQTRGNPLFTVELLRGMQERGDLIRNEQDQWIEGTALDWEKLPSRVEAVVAERVGRLAEPLLTILRIASVEGEVFTAEVVARVLGQDEQDLLVSLGSELDRKHRLVKAQSIMRKGDDLLSAYQFRHILFQRYLYHSLNAVERVHLHEQIGRTLEEIHGPAAERMPIALQLARHFEEAQINRKAIHYLHQAAQNALELSAYQEGIAHTQKALFLLHEIPASSERDRQELALQVSLAIAFRGVCGSQSEDMLEAWGRARELSRRTGEWSQHCFILGEMSTNNYVRAEYQDALTLGNQALALARETENPLLVAMGHWYVGLALFATANFTKAHEHFAETISFYNPQEHHQQFISVRGSDTGLSALAYDACCLWALGYPTQGRQSSERALTLARTFGHPFTLADVLCYGGCLYHQMRRDAQAQLELVIEFRQLLESFGPGVWLAQAKCIHGNALARIGQVDKGLELIESGLSAHQSAGQNIYASIHFCCLAEALARKGRIDESWSALNHAFAIAEARNERLWSVNQLLLKAHLLTMEGKEEQAIRSLHKAIETARHQDARALELRASAALAQLYAVEGKEQTALSILTPIVEWFGDGLEPNELQKARELLSRLNDSRFA